MSGAADPYNWHVTVEKGEAVVFDGGMSPRFHDPGVSCVSGMCVWNEVAVLEIEGYEWSVGVYTVTTTLTLDPQVTHTFTFTLTE